MLLRMFNKHTHYVRIRPQRIGKLLSVVTHFVPGEPKLIPVPNYRVLKHAGAFLTRKSILTSYNLAVATAPGFQCVQAGPAFSTSYGRIRFAHTDITVPDFTKYRRKATISPTSRQADSADDRRAFSYVFAMGLTLGMLYVTRSHTVHYVAFMDPSADVLALAQIEISLSNIPEGMSVTFKWRGKPLFVMHRTPEQIRKEQAVAVGSLRDPQHDNERVQNPEWLVVVGVCTHLGCVPIANAGDFGGYYCPCHGSHFDASGRVRKGPAPLNLEVPPYVFEGDNKLVIG